MFTVGPSLWGGSRDPNFANVVALLHLNGTNGSTTFTDQISANTWAVGTGSPTISTAQSKFGGASLIVPDSSPSSVRNTNAPALLLSADYSIEAWVYIVTGGNLYAFYMSTTTSGITLQVDGTNVSHFRGTDTTVSVNDGAGPLAGRWVHVYAGRQGTTNYVACNGVMLSNTGSSSVGATYDRSEIGTGFTGSGTAGYVDELRVTKGVCRYTSSFTPPTSPFPDS